MAWVVGVRKSCTRGKSIAQRYYCAFTLISQIVVKYSQSYDRKIT